MADRKWGEAGDMQSEMKSSEHILEFVSWG